MTREEQLELEKKWREETNKAAEKGFNTIYTDSGQQVPNAESAKADNDDHQQQDLGGEAG